MRPVYLTLNLPLSNAPLPQSEDDRYILAGLRLLVASPGEPYASMAVVDSALVLSVWPIHEGVTSPL